MFSFYYDTDGSLYCMEYEQDQDILPEYPKKNAAFPSSNRLTLVINYIKRGSIQEKNMAECVHRTWMPPLLA